MDRCARSASARLESSTSSIGVAGSASDADQSGRARRGRPSASRAGSVAPSRPRWRSGQTGQEGDHEHGGPNDVTSPSVRSGHVRLSSGAIVPPAHAFPCPVLACRACRPSDRSAATVAVVAAGLGAAARSRPRRRRPRRPTSRASRRSSSKRGRWSSTTLVSGDAGLRRPDADPDRDRVRCEGSRPGRAGAHLPVHLPQPRVVREAAGERRLLRAFVRHRRRDLRDGRAVAVRPGRPGPLGARGSRPPSAMHWRSRRGPGTKVRGSSFPSSMGRPSHGPVRSRRGCCGHAHRPATRPVAARPRAGRQPPRGQCSGAASRGTQRQAIVPPRLADDRRRSRPARRQPADRHERRGHRRRARHAAVHACVAVPALAGWISRPKTGRPGSAADGRLEAAGLRAGRPTRRIVPRAATTSGSRPSASIGRCRGYACSSSSYPGNRVYRWGCAGTQQRLSLRARPQRVQAAPRRVRPGPAQEGHEGVSTPARTEGRHLRRVVVEGHDARRRARGRTRASRARA